MLIQNLAIFNHFISSDMPRETLSSVVILDYINLTFIKTMSQIQYNCENYEIKFLFTLRYRVNPCACATRTGPRGSWTKEDVKVERI